MRKHLSKLAVATLATAYLTTAASAIDDGPRMYWNIPKDLNIIMTYAWAVNGNAVNQTGAVYDPNANVNINILLFGYNRSFDMFGHTAIVSVVLPAGNADATVNVNNSGGLGILSVNRTSRGIGDMYFQGTFNIFGGEAVTMEEYMTTYKQGTLLSLILGVNTPTGQYNGDQSVNIGLNRWAGRIALPFVQTLGAWKPGSITTLEITPGVWFYGDNGDYRGGTFKQDPLYSVEAHLTQDLTPAAFVSLDYMYQTGGETEVDGGLVPTTEKSDAQNVDTIGLSLGYMLNPATQFVFRYNAALAPKSDELDMGIMEFNLNYLF